MYLTIDETFKCSLPLIFLPLILQLSMGAGARALVKLTGQIHTPACRLSLEASTRGTSDSWSDMVPDDAHSLKMAVHMAAERGYDESLKILIE